MYILKEITSIRKKITESVVYFRRKIPFEERRWRVRARKTRRNRTPSTAPSTSPALRADRQRASMSCADRQRLSIACADHQRLSIACADRQHPSISEARPSISQVCPYMYMFPVRPSVFLFRPFISEKSTKSYPFDSPFGVTCVAC